MIIEDITEFTIYEVAKLKNIFIEILGNTQDIVIDMKNIQKIDMVGIQLLVSFVKSVQEADSTLNFVNISDDLLEQIEVCNCTKVLGLSND